MILCIIVERKVPAPYPYKPLTAVGSSITIEAKDSATEIILVRI
jgi:hypothetical protein